MPYTKSEELAVPTATSRKYVLAVFLEGRPEDGGAYRHKQNLLKAYARLQSSGIRIVVVCDSIETLAEVEKHSLEGTICRVSVLGKAWRFIASQELIRRAFGKAISRMPLGVDSLLSKLQASLAVFYAGDSRALEVIAHSFVIQFWDACHVEHPEFPEVAYYGEFERREYFNRNALPRATAIVADSAHTASLISTRYGVSASRIFVAPFL